MLFPKHFNLSEIDQTYYLMIRRINHSGRNGRIEKVFNDQCTLSLNKCTRPSATCLYGSRLYGMESLSRNDQDILIGQIWSYDHA